MGWNRVVLAVWLCWQFACAQPQPTRDTRMTPIPPGKVSLEVTLALRTNEVIAGAEIPITVTLRNTAATGGVFVHSPEADMPFIFTLESEKGDTFEISRDLFLQQTMPNPPPPREQEMAPLRAGATIEYKVDLAKWISAPLRPGRYKLSAIYPLRGAIYRSAPIQVPIMAPRARLFEVAPSGNGLSLGAALVHVDETGAPMLYQSESESGSPALSVLRMRRPLRRPTSLALSTDGEGATEPRWLGWTDEGNAWFLNVWGDAELFATAATPLAQGARLVSPGWTFDDESAAFLTATVSELSLITIQNREQPRVKMFPISGGIANPAALRAGFFKTQQEPAARRWLVVWPEGNRLLASLVNPDGEATSARELARREEPLVALDMEPVGREAAPIIHAVFAGASGATLVRVRAGEETQATALPPLPHVEPGEDLHWTVLSGKAPAVMAQTGASRLLGWTSGGEWRVLYDSPDASVGFVRLAALQQPWAVWTSAAAGVQLRELK